MRNFFLFWAFLLLLPSFVCRAQADTLFVSDKHVVHLVCGAEITDVEVSDEDLVYVRVMDNNPNIAGLMSFGAFEGVTSLMVVDANKSVYVYYLAYKIEPGVLVRHAGDVSRYLRGDSVQQAEAAAPAVVPAGSRGASQRLAKDAAPEGGLPKGMGPLAYKVGEFRKGLITHVGQKSFGVSVECDRLYVEGDRIYFRFVLENRSSLSYSFGNVVFQVERPGGNGGAKVRKSKLQEGKQAVEQEVVSLVEPGQTVYCVFVFDKFSLRKQEQFQVFFNEEVDTGTRAFELVFDARDINGAVMRR